MGDASSSRVDVKLRVPRFWLDAELVSGPLPAPCDVLGQVRPTAQGRTHSHPANQEPGPVRREATCRTRHGTAEDLADLPQIPHLPQPHERHHESRPHPGETTLKTLTESCPGRPADPERPLRWRPVGPRRRAAGFRPPRESAARRRGLAGQPAKRAPRPPSTGSSAPVMPRAPGPSRKATASAASRGSHIRRIGCTFTTSASAASGSGWAAK